jgi:hypothetical protein
MADTVETAIYRLRIEGQDQLDRLTQSIEGLATAEEDATKATRTTSEELQRRVARYDPLIRAQQAYRKELEYIERAQEAGVGTQQEINALFEGATARYQAAKNAAAGLADAHKGLDAQGQAAFHSMRSIFEQLALGVPITQALTQVSGLLGQGLRHRLDLAARSIREGLPISVSLDAQALTTPVALRMLRVGERTGQMGEMMERIAVFHEEELARWVERFTKVFEPLLMAVIGVVIGGIVVLMYFPIFELAGSMH